MPAATPAGLPGRSSTSLLFSLVLVLAVTAYRLYVDLGPGHRPLTGTNKAIDFAVLPLLAVWAVVRYFRRRTLEQSYTAMQAGSQPGSPAGTFQR